MSFSDFWEMIESDEEVFWYRYTFGSGISDKNVRFSFTMYGFRPEKFSYQQVEELRDLFIKELDKWVRSQYPNKNYTYGSDWWGSPIYRAETDTEIELEEYNVPFWEFEVYRGGILDEQTSGLLVLEHD